MIKRIFHIVLWCTLLAWLTLFTGFIAGRNDEVLCRKLTIGITDSAAVRFITPGAVEAMIADAGIEIRGYPVSSIHTRQMESLLKENPYISDAQVFVTVEGELRIDIEQRIPLLRIMPGGSGGFYLDEEGIVLPLSESFAPMVLPVTGSTNLPALPPGASIYELEWENENYREDYGYLAELMEFARFISADPFWSKQVVQVYRNSRGEFELIPRVGAHHILLGTMEDHRKKMRNLKLLYEQGFARNGWNSYDKINLKYSNQVICTKR